MSDNAKQLEDAAYSLALPRNYYRFRCVEAEDVKTKTGNNMIKLKLEIIPRDANTPTIVSGVKIDGLSVYANTVITDKSVNFHNVVRSAFGLNRIAAHEIEQSVAAQFKGLECYALAQGTNEPDKTTSGEPILDPYTGKPRMVTKREIVEFAPRPE